MQAQKFSRTLDDDDEGDLGEDNFLDSPLDKIEPYQLFKGALLSKSFPQHGVVDVLTCVRDATRTTPVLRVINGPSFA